MATKERKNELIVLADQAIKYVFKKEISGEGIPENYNGQMAAFSVAIATSGLKPAIAFYSNKNSDAGKIRERIIAIVLFMYNKERHEGISQDAFVDKFKNLQNDDVPAIQKLIIEYAVAAKLVLRTFKFKSNDK